MKKKYLSFIVLVVLIAMLLPAGVVLASFGYYIPITVFNNWTDDRANIPVLVVINNTQLADLGYILPSGLDTHLVEGGEGIYSMVATSRLAFFISSIEEGQERLYHYLLGTEEPREGFPLMVGTGGNITVEDDPSLELGDEFMLEASGWIDTSQVGGNLVYKEEAFRLYIPSEGTVRAAILGGGDVENLSVNATGLSPEIMSIWVLADGEDFAIYLDGDEVDSVSLGGHSVPDNSNIWYLMNDDGMPYAFRFRIWTP